jgi:acyl-CoA thioesterase
MGRFDDDTAVHAEGGGRYAARIDRGWWIERGPNGGYMAAILVRAMSTEVADPARRVRSVSLHFLRPPADGDAWVEVVIERAGATLSTVTARMHQDGKLIAIALAAFATDRDGADFSIRDRYDQRHCIGTAHGERGDAVTGGWLRLAEGSAVDEHVLVAMSDAWYPAVFARLALPVGVPTIDLTVHLRNPAPAGTEWVLVRFRTRVSAGGFLEEDGELWHPDGTLLAQSRQLALLLAP